ncbi:MAG: efflux RND transporter periplasmic adaptor subunit [candidate division FCPU426 bacterium]
MSRNLEHRWFGLGFAVVALALAGCSPKGQGNEVQTVQPEYGSIQVTVSTTGTVEPQNRLELKPPIAGRVDQILVQEGDQVRRGQTLAWMSSTERAALLDAARSQGEKGLAEWSDAYKPAPVVSPINGTVIVRGVEPGQTVSVSDAILVLSDRLIVKAQVDETDIGKVQVGQDATVSLDAYPDIRVPSRVDHIAYESQVINNVTIYEVDILPNQVPPVFRSGMSATADIIVAAKEHALLVPREAVQEVKGKFWVAVSQGAGKPSLPRQVGIGLKSDNQTEVVSGIGPEDTLAIETPDLSLLRGNSEEQKTNPFMPRRPGGGRGRSR